MKRQKKKAPLLLISFANKKNIDNIEDYCGWLKLKDLNEVFCDPIFRSALQEAERDRVLSDLRFLQQRVHTFLLRLIDMRFQIQNSRRLAERLWEGLGWMEDYKPYTLLPRRVAGWGKGRYYPERELIKEYNPRMPWRHVYNDMETFLNEMRPVVPDREDRRKEKLILRVKICITCNRFFWDPTNNMNKSYCSTKCGNLARQKRFRNARKMNYQPT